MNRLFIITLAIAGLALSACNTVEGAGRDLSSVGHAVASTAHDAK
jgi:predicted small secreted protein